MHHSPECVNSNGTLFAPINQCAIVPVGKFLAALTRFGGVRWGEVGPHHTEHVFLLARIDLRPDVQHLGGLPAFALWIDCEQGDQWNVEKRATFLAKLGLSSLSPVSMRLILECETFSTVAKPLTENPRYSRHSVRK